jgi:hypothetical protein
LEVYVTMMVAPATHEYHFRISGCEMDVPSAKAVVIANPIPRPPPTS